ncbi:MAG: hypothetical protein ACSLE9_00605, partial [Burkholderiaceae bacterium]
MLLDRAAGNGWRLASFQRKGRALHQKFLWASSALLLACTGAAKAADWSDTAISVRYGTAFAEPYNNN